MKQWQLADWPGNVRELRNFAERLVLDIVPAGIAAVPPRDTEDNSLSLPGLLDKHERSLIVEALTAASGNVAGAAEQLGIPRKTLYDKLKKYSLLQGR